MSSLGFPHLTFRPLHDTYGRYWKQHPFLELLLIKQFLFGGVWYKDKGRPKLIWELIDLGVDLNIPSLPNTDMTELLCVAFGLIPTIGGPTREMERLFDAFHSLHQDSVNWSKVFLAVVKTNNTEVFKFFLRRSPIPDRTARPRF